VTFDFKQCARREPLYDINPQTGVSIEVFYADQHWKVSAGVALVGFGGARRRGFSPDGPATGPFVTSYAAYHHALGTDLGAKLNTLLDKPVKSEV
jgi:hypothetical protein